MKKSVISILLCIAIVLSSAAMSLTAFAESTGTTYYVDSVNGNDQNSGKSPSAAWRTLAKASANTYTAGDKILLKAGGIYTDTFTANGSGTAENPVTVSSYGDIAADGKPMLYSNKDVILILIKNVNGWLIENLELSAPNGKGIHVIADNGKIMSDISIKNCDMHDIYFKKFPEVNLRDNRYSAVFAVAFGKNSRIDNLTISGCNVYNCAYGLYTEGITFEGTPDIFVSPEESYNQNVIIENTSLYNIYYDAAIIRADNNAIIRNCSIIKASLSYQDNWYTAPMYMANVKNVLVENCEIAGAENYNDGMAVDFDGWTTDSTYQYVYSHDNIRFMSNCLYDLETKNRNCTVRYCLSVNDNKGPNYVAQPCRYGMNYMENFKFYNNTIVNGSDFRRFELLINSYVANNIFYSEGVDHSVYTRREYWNVDKEKMEPRVFDGTFTNNCFYGYSVPFESKNYMTKDPQFVGTDFTDKNSFKLSEESKLIGKGVQVEEDMGEHDFYGNPLTDTHNIGCYEGAGEKTENSKSILSYPKDFFVKIITAVVGFFKSIGYYYD